MMSLLSSMRTLSFTSWEQIFLVLHALCRCLPFPSPSWNFEQMDLLALLLSSYTLELHLQDRAHGACLSQETVFFLSLDIFGLLSKSYANL